MTDFWSEAAQNFGSLFEKPKMSDKLLQKPPFRYIFDIILETIKVTNFAQGLYNEDELNPNQQKEQKIIFLKKIIDLVQYMENKECPAKPNKIVAGLEPENTNAMLNAIYRCAVSGQDSKPYVQKVLSKMASAGPTGGEEQKPVEQPKQQPSKQKTQEADKEQQQQQQAQAQAAEKQKQKEEMQKKEAAKKQQQEDLAAAAKKQQEEQQQEQKSKQRPPQPQADKQAPAQEKKQQLDARELQQQQIVRPSTATKKPPKLQKEQQVSEQTQGKKQGPTGLILDNQRNFEEDLDQEDQQQDNTNQNNIQFTNVDAKKHGKFVREAMEDNEPQQQSEQNQNNLVGNQPSGIKMGKLGAKKKGTVKQDEAIVQQLSGKDDVDAIKNFVQTLCQNINPLGKSLEFLQDDIESLNKENELWRRQYLESKDKYQVELRKTEDEIQPLQDKLAQVEEQINDQKAKIQSLKAQIIRNQTTIQNLLYSVVQQK